MNIKRTITSIGLALAGATTVFSSALPARASSSTFIWKSAAGQCVDADLNTIGANGTRVQLWTCNGSLQQRWTITGSATAQFHTIVSQYSHRCFDADTNTSGDGAKVQLWDCNGQPQQNWQTLYF